MASKHQSKLFKTPAYLWQNRHGTYFFRARIPILFHSYFGKSELKKSLKTDSRREAIKLARAYRVELDKEMAKLEKGSHKAFEVTLEGRIPHPTKHGEFITGKITRTLSAPDEDTYQHKKQLTDQLREEAQHQARLESIAVQPSLLQSTSEQVKITPPLSEVINSYQEEGETLQRWNSKTLPQIKATLKLPLEIVGDMPIGSFNKEVAREFKQKYIKLPANINKKREYKDKSINELLNMDIPEDHRLAHNTINNNLIRISTFFKWAEDNGYVDKNPMSGLTLGKKKRASEERQAFNQYDLKSLFESAEYKKGFKEAYCHWVPIIALYTGARLEEICRIRLENFKEIDDIKIIEVAPDKEWKGKSSAAMRIVPMHPKLIELGLLDFVTDQQDKGHTRLFPELSGQRDGYGARVSKWFARYRKKCGITESGKVFHSFRHTLANELKQNSVPIEISKAILGHEDASMTYGRYGKTYKVEVMYEAVKQVDFELKHPRQIY